MSGRIYPRLKRSACLFRKAHGHWPTQVRMPSWDIEYLQRELEPRDLEELKSKLELIPDEAVPFQTVDADGNACTSGGNATCYAGEAFRVRGPESSFASANEFADAEMLFYKWIPSF